MDYSGAKKYEKFSRIVKERYQLKSESYTSTKQILPYTDEMFDVFDKSYSKLSSFVPISQRQKDFFKKKYMSFINPEFIQFVFNKDDKMVGFAIMMPSFSEALQKAKGKIFPFGMFHLLKAKKK